MLLISDLVTHFEARETPINDIEKYVFNDILMAMKDEYKKKTFCLKMKSISLMRIMINSQISSLNLIKSKIRL